MIEEAAMPSVIECDSPAVTTRGLVKKYGRTVALAGVDLTIPEGAFYLLVGANGAGKSTVLRILIDLVRPDAGEVRVFGVDPATGPLVRAGVGYVPENYDELYGWMRVDEAIRFHASYFVNWDREYAARLAHALGLRPDTRVGRLSKGQARRMQLLLAMAHRPPMLILDEPTDGLDPAARELFLQLLAEHLADTPTTVLISTHLVYEMDRLADHIGVLTEGRLAVQLPRTELDRRLRSYDLECPEHWTPAGGREGTTVLRRRGQGREQSWMVWGDEDEVTSVFRDSGAEVRAVSPVALNDAAVAWVTADCTPARTAP